MAKPRLLDLFCGAGGAGEGYRCAGFDVVGVDNKPQPNYPFEFVQGDALSSLVPLLLEGRGFAAVHASPPCQRYSDLQRRSKLDYPDLVAGTRRILKHSGLPYVIENVDGAPLREPVLLCGTQFKGLRVIRHRLFETNWPLTAPEAHPYHPLVFTHDKRKAHYGKLDQDRSFVQVTGGGNATLANKLDAMSVDWMTSHHEINEAIPPAYTEWVGRQLMRHLRKRSV